MARAESEPFLGTTDALTLKKWALKTRKKTLDETIMASLVGGEDAVITDVTDLQTGGDEVTYPLLANLVGKGVSGNQTLTGNEEDMTFYSDKLRIDHTRHGVYVGDKLSAQRNPGLLRNKASALIADWEATVVMDPSFFNHAAGYTPANTGSGNGEENQRGHNTIVAPSRIYRAASIATDELVAADSTAKISVAGIDELIEQANTAGTGAQGRLRKPSGGWKLLVHWSQFTELLQEAEMRKIHIAAISGGNSKEALLSAKTSLMYRDVEIIPSNFVPKGVNSSTGAAVNNTRRAIFCGAGALSIAYGSGYAGGAWDWEEDDRDFKNKKYVSAGLIWGLKANVFGSVDYGKIVYTTYSA